MDQKNLTYHVLKENQMTKSKEKHHFLNKNSSIEEGKQMAKKVFYS